MNNSLYYYKAHIIDVYDGDTVTAEIDLGFFVKFKEKFRLLGINTPELRGSEREQGLVSRDAVREKILNKEVQIKTERDRKGKYGRYLATIFIEEDNGFTNVNEWIVNSGYGVFHDY